MKPWEQTFFDAYVACALWSSTDDYADESGGEPLDRNYGPEDIAPETLAKMQEDCLAFRKDNEADLDASGLKPDRQGHDFWLDRNGHGSGFWDEYFNGSPESEACARLSAACKAWGTFDLYIGDDGRIYGS